MRHVADSLLEEHAAKTAGSSLQSAVTDKSNNKKDKKNKQDKTERKKKKKDKKNKKEGEAPSPTIPGGAGFVEIGPWRFGNVDGVHFSVSHQSGKTAVIFRSDGNVFPGPLGFLGLSSLPLLHLLRIEFQFQRTLWFCRCPLYQKLLLYQNQRILSF